MFLVTERNYHHSIQIVGEANLCENEIIKIE